MCLSRRKQRCQRSICQLYVNMCWNRMCVCAILRFVWFWLYMAHARRILEKWRLIQSHIHNRKCRIKITIRIPNVPNKNRYIDTFGGIILFCVICSDYWRCSQRCLKLINSAKWLYFLSSEENEIGNNKFHDCEKIAFYPCKRYAISYTMCVIVPRRPLFKNYRILRMYLWAYMCMHCTHRDRPSESFIQVKSFHNH